MSLCSCDSLEKESRFWISSLIRASSAARFSVVIRSVKKPRSVSTFKRFSVSLGFEQIHFCRADRNPTWRVNPLVWTLVADEIGRVGSSGSLSLLLVEADDLRSEIWSRGSTISLLGDGTPLLSSWSMYALVECKFSSSRWSSSSKVSTSTLICFKGLRRVNAISASL